MRFWIVFLAAGVMIKSTTCLGQVRFEKGVKAGFNYTNLDLSTVGRLGNGVINRYHWNPSFHFGVYCLIKLPKNHKLSKLSLQPELVFSRQGQRFTTPYNSDLRTAFYYVNVPIIIKYYLTGALNLQLGPQFGIMAGSKGDLLQIYNGYIYGLAIENQSLKGYTNRPDFSLAFGLGLDVPFGGSLTVRYNVGISDANKLTNANPNTLPANSNGVVVPSISTAFARNQVFQVSLGYRLKKKKKK
jgi:hypothetical protein